MVKKLELTGNKYWIYRQAHLSVFMELRNNLIAHFISSLESGFDLCHKHDSAVSIGWLGILRSISQ